jgi:hypothetical protein
VVRPLFWLFPPSRQRKRREPVKFSDTLDRRATRAAVPSPQVRSRVRGAIPIGVNLPPDGVVNVRASFSPGMSEPAVHIGAGPQEIIEREAADNGKQQHTPGEAPYGNGPACHQSVRSLLGVALYDAGHWTVWPDAIRAVGALAGRYCRESLHTRTAREGGPHLNNALQCGTKFAFILLRYTGKLKTSATVTWTARESASGRRSMPSLATCESLT